MFLFRKNWQVRQTSLKFSGSNQTNTSFVSCVWIFFFVCVYVSWSIAIDRYDHRFWVSTFGIWLRKIYYYYIFNMSDHDLLDIFWSAKFAQRINLDCHYLNGFNCSLLMPVAFILIIIQSKYIQRFGQMCTMIKSSMSPTKPTGRYSVSNEKKKNVCIWSHRVRHLRDKFILLLLFYEIRKTVCRNVLFVETNSVCCFCLSSELESEQEHKHNSWMRGIFLML